MKLETVREALGCRVVTGEDRLAAEVKVGCGADLMSDVLAFIKPQALLLTGLPTVQSVRTADVAEVIAIVYVRGKQPEPEAVALAQEKGIVLLATGLPMYEACGRLYARGLRGVSEVEADRSNCARTAVFSAL